MAKFSSFVVLCLLSCVVTLGQSEALLVTPPSQFSLKKCFTDVAIEYKCMREIASSFWLPSATIDQECCMVLDEFNEDYCSNVVYAPLQSPILKNALKNHCTKQTPTPTPTPTILNVPPKAPLINLRKCFDDVAVEYRCMKEIMSSFWLPSVTTIHKDCCEVVDQFNEDCSIVVYAPLHGSLLKNVFKNLCSKT
ncbi:hypothetical protein TanjilG_29586 [Lupinus angustifolius]|uniref:Prolamin-like domain-containing protein n=1 Tax=Lupinus angustifolius TaxID=3871 RepID=A0A4P1R6B9_LUPAN|nr:hypothetical protein TanjilG_29586 [Lupinus angustifolius]